MRFKHILWAAAAILAVTAISCKKEEPQAETTLSVNPTSLTFGSAGDSKTVTVTCSSSDWQPKTSADWLTILPANDGKTFKVTAAKNEAAEGECAPERKATINVMADNKKVEIAVTQAAETVVFKVEGDTTPAQFPSDGGTLKVKITTNQAYTVKVEGDSWIKEAATKAVVEKELTYKISVNDAATAREGSLTITPADGSATKIVVKQAAKAEDVLSVDPTSLSFKNEGEAKTVTVTASTSWDATSDASWLTVLPANDGKTFKVSAAKNEAEAGKAAPERKANIKVKAGAKEVTIVAIQSAETVVFKVLGDVTPANFPAEGGTLKVDVTYNTGGYQVNTPDSWVAQTLTKATVTDNLTFAIAPNDGDDERQSVLQFIPNTGEVVKLTVTQAGKSSAKLTEIKSVEDWTAFAAAAHTYDPADVVTFAADLDAAGADLAQIDTLKCVLDGQGHSIKNWKYDNHALIGIIAGTLKNLKFDASCKLEHTEKLASTHIGVISTYNWGTIENVENNADFLISAEYGASSVRHIGIFVAVNRATLKNCVNNGKFDIKFSTVTGKGAIRAGAFIGSNTPDANNPTTLLYNCVNNGAVTYEANTLSANSYLGGFIGVYDGTANNGASMVQNCTNNGKLTVTMLNTPARSIYVGGLAGQRNGGNVKNFCNYGDITNNNTYGAKLSDYSNIGGIFGNQKTASVVAPFDIEGGEINCTLTSAYAPVDGKFPSAGLILGNILTADQALTVGTAANPVKVSGKLVYSGDNTAVEVTADNFQNYLVGSLSDLSTHSVNAVFNGAAPAAEAVAVAIASAADFVKFAQDFNAGVYAGKIPNLTVSADLVFDDATSKALAETGGVGTAGDEELGIADNYFGGTLDGGNHVVKNLVNYVCDVVVVDSIVARAPLFAFTGSQSVIKDLVFDESCNLAVEKGTFGAAVGRNKGLVENIVCNANVNIKPIAGTSYIAGIVGRNYGGTVKNCTMNGSVLCINSTMSTSKEWRIGGICGSVEDGGTVTGCKFGGHHQWGLASAGDGPSLSNGKYYFGGIAGDLMSGTISDCHFDGVTASTDIRGKAGRNGYVGGIAGNVSEMGTVSGCSCNSPIYVRSKGPAGEGYEDAFIYVGGIAGYNAGSVLNSTVKASATENNAGMTNNSAQALLCLGGIVGMNDGDISGCANEGLKMVGPTQYTTALQSYVGGLVGKTTKSLANMGNAGEICTSTKSTTFGSVKENYKVVGGCVGFVDGPATLENLTNTGKIYYAMTDGKINGSGSMVGGVVGLLKGGATVKGCSNSGAVCSNNYNNSYSPIPRASIAGGIVGVIQCADGQPATIDNCTNAGPVTVRRGVLGCIVGWSQNSVIKNCSVTNGTTATATAEPILEDISAFMGGIVGNAEQTTVSDCTVGTKENPVTLGYKGATAPCTAGGVVGEMIDEACAVRGCTFIGTITTAAEQATNTSVHGGIVGKSAEKSVISNCKFKAKFSLGGVEEDLSIYDICSDNNFENDGTNELID